MNLAIIGSGAMGAYHAGFATQCGLKVVACGDTVKANAQKLAAQYGAASTADCLSLCRRGDVDVVAICTPTPSHVEFLVAAAEAGKHIFCEKPLARTNEQCAAALAAVNKAGVKLFAAHVVRYFQEFEAIREQIVAGKVGKPGFVRTSRGGICPIGEGHWFRDYAQSGGVTMDTIIHDFDWLRYVFGDPQRVFCQNIHDRLDEGIDYSLVTLRMKTGVIVNTVGTWAQPSGFRVRVEVCGDKGMIQYDSADAPIASMMRESAGGAPGMIVPSSPVAESPYLLEWRDFAAWLEGKHAPRVTPEDGAWAVRIALAALESAEKGQPMAF
jgi:predicted dehydrogenase